MDSAHPAALLNKLLVEGFEVIHSPRNSSDVRWRDWYDVGLLNVLEQTDIFISAITETWPGSTWMQYEALESRKRLEVGKIRKMYVYNPDNIEPIGSGMPTNLDERLPDDLDDTVLVLKAVK